MRSSLGIISIAEEKYLPQIDSREVSYTFIFTVCFVQPKVVSVIYL